MRSAATKSPWFHARFRFRWILLSGFHFAFQLDCEIRRRYFAAGSRIVGFGPHNPADDNRGDWWDHTAFDAEHKLVLCVVPGARGEEAEAVVAEVKLWTGGHPLRLMTSDDYPAYKEAIVHAYGTEVTTTPTGRSSKRMVPEKVVPPELIPLISW